MPIVSPSQGFLPSYKNHPEEFLTIRQFAERKFFQMLEVINEDSHRKLIVTALQSKEDGLTMDELMKYLEAEINFAGKELCWWKVITSFY